MAGQAVRPLAELAASGIRRGLAASAAPAAWGLGALSGRLAEISGSHSCASLTLVFRLVLEAQTGQEPVAWITGMKDLVSGALALCAIRLYLVNVSTEPGPGALGVRRPRYFLLRCRSNSLNAFERSRHSMIYPS